jgi:hypothetical protein
MTALTLPRPSARGWRILAAALGSSLALQLAIVAGTLLPGYSALDAGADSVLLDGGGSLGDVVGILWRNAAWLAAITLLAWPIARLWSWGLNDSWDPAWINLAARRLYPGVAVLLLLTLWWVFSRQALLLSESLAGRWALFALFGHGTLELTALLLPLCAAASCVRAPARRPGRRLLAAVAVALPLLVLAALVEVFLSPRLLAPLRAP